MPSYEYSCCICSRIKNELKSVSKRNELPICDECGIVMRRIISPSAIKVNGFNEKNGYSHTSQSIKGE
jgi:putative FmdB family regulatory protein